MTRDELTADVILYANNDSEEFVASIDGFLARAVNVLNRRMVVRGQLRTFGPLPLAGATLQLPPGFASMVGLKVRPVGTARWISLDQKMPGYLDEFWPADEVSYLDDGLTPQPPRAWALVDEDTVRIAPLPLGAWEYAMTCRVDIPPLSADNPSNWWSEREPHALFAVTMWWASLYMRDDSQAERIERWRKTAEELGVDLAAYDQRASRDDRRQPTSIAENRP